MGWAGKLALVAALPVVLGLVGFAAVTLNDVRRVTRDAIERGQRDEAFALAHGLSAAEIERPDLAARMNAAAAAIGARVTIVGGDGAVLADSEVDDTSRVENHGQRPEVVAAREVGWGKDTRTSRTVKRELLYTAARIPGTDAVARVARDTSDVDAKLSQATRQFWGAGIVLVLLGVLAAVLLARRLSRPIRELTGAVQRISADEPDARVYPRGTDEIARLGEAFNALTDQQRRTLDRAQGEAARLATILEGMTEGVIAVSREEKISFLNSAARDILGLHPTDDFEGRRFYELVRDPSILGMVQVAASRGEATESEIRHEGPPRRMIAVHAAPVGQETPGVIVVLRDMSRLRRLEQMRSDFVSNVSHELRTPLASIAAGVETLQDDATRIDEQAGPRFLAMIRRNLERLEALLNDILALSRLESVPETLPMEPVDLGSLARTSAEELRDRAERGGVELKIAADDRQLVRGDYSTLRKVVDNLILNAITYTSAGGSVTIEIGTENDCATLRVADTGIGIPKDEVDRIFERFYRVDKARSRSVGGTGLGLAIVKHGVGLHGGSVGVVSQLTKGSTFTVRIPLADRAGVTDS